MQPRAGGFTRGISRMSIEPNPVSGTGQRPGYTDIRTPTGISSAERQRLKVPGEGGEVIGFAHMGRSPATNASDRFPGRPRSSSRTACPFLAARPPWRTCFGGPGTWKLPFKAVPLSGWQGILALLMPRHCRGSSPTEDGAAARTECKTLRRAPILFHWRILRKGLVVCPTRPLVSNWDAVNLRHVWA